MKKITYKKSGVDVDKANLAVKKIKNMVKATFNKNVLANIGLFGSLYQINKKQVLVSTVDGVGTKLKLAFKTNKHNTVGIDLVNHCVNDVLVQGATPLFFMDYIATGKLKPGTIVEIMKGFTKACKENKTCLIGGEIAEMPGMYKKNHYDLVGIIVGVVDKNKILMGKNIKKGDKIYGLKSSGLHTNGYSLVNKLLEKNKLDIKTLMIPHKSYLKQIKPYLSQIKGMAHITGGGFYDNISRILPKGCSALIYKKSWNIPKIFKQIKKLANLNDKEMFRTFNMGIGLVLVGKKVPGSIEIGEIVKGNGKVIIK